MASSIRTNQEPEAATSSVSMSVRSALNQEYGTATPAERCSQSDRSALSTTQPAEVSYIAKLRTLLALFVLDA